jgi:hypothetical protein
MILAEKRGLPTPENRAAARAAIEEKLSGRTDCDRRDHRAVICSTNPHLRACRAFAGL